jgi:hypothetical protein
MLMQGEKVWIFVRGREPFQREVSRVVDVVSIQKKHDAFRLTKAHEDKALLEEVPCIGSLYSFEPRFIAEIARESLNRDGYGIVVRGLPANVLIANGPGTPARLEMDKSPYAPLVKHLAAEACRAPGSTAQSRTFQAGAGRELVQLEFAKIEKLSPATRKKYIEEAMRGVDQEEAMWSKHPGHYKTAKEWMEYRQEVTAATEKKEYAESMDVCQVFLYGNRVLKTNKIEHRPGPNYSMDGRIHISRIERGGDVLGFISLDNGKDWDMLHLAYGYESVNYIIQRISDSAELFTGSSSSGH